MCAPLLYPLLHHNWPYCVDLEFEEKLVHNGIPTEPERRLAALVRMCRSAVKLSKGIQSLLRSFQCHTKRVHLERESYTELLSFLKVGRHCALFQII